MIEKRALSVDEFCHAYGIGRTLAYEEIRFGRLAAYKLGKLTRISADAAEEWFRLVQEESKSSKPHRYIPFRKMAAVVSAEG